MIIWLTGNSGAGKTTLGKKLCSGPNTILLDGDELREVWPGLTMGFADRWENNVRTARLAKLLESQGNTVVVAMICPYEHLRETVQEICGCSFIYVEGGKPNSNEYPYQPPKNPLMVHKRKSIDD